MNYSFQSVFRDSDLQARSRLRSCITYSTLRSGSSVTGLDWRFVGWRDLHVRRFDSPDLAGVLGDGPVAGELSRGGDVADHHLGPLFGVLKGNRKLLV